MEQDNIPSLKEKIFAYICKNPGKDAEDVAIYFKIPQVLAIELVEELLNQGKLDFNE